MLATVTQSLLVGVGKTMEIFVMTLLFALPLGLIIAFGSMSRFRLIKALSKTLVWVIRGTPLMLQLIVIFYGPGLIGSWAEDFVADTAFAVDKRYVLVSKVQMLAAVFFKNPFVPVKASIAVKSLCEALSR